MTFAYIDGYHNQGVNWLCQTEPDDLAGFLLWYALSQHLINHVFFGVVTNTFVFFEADIFRQKCFY